MTIAEESTSWPKVTHPTRDGGLGFTHKWNMGWMHDTLGYLHNDPVHRRWHHHELSFGLLYAFTESFVLPLSHDEVVHGKGSLLGKMAGDDWQRFANLRALYAWMWALPGAPLLFMGAELAPWTEWNDGGGLPWHLLDHAPHRGVRDLLVTLERRGRAVAGGVGARPRRHRLPVARRRRRRALAVRLRPVGARRRARRWCAWPTSRRCPEVGIGWACRGPARGRSWSTPMPRGSVAAVRWAIVLAVEATD